MAFIRSRQMPRRAIALALAVGLVGAGVGVAAAKQPKDSCLARIAGTYHRPAEALYNLSADGTITGTLSETTQETVAGQGETFVGQWKCSGTTMTGRDFRWVDNDGVRRISRFDWAGTFSPDNGGTLNVVFSILDLDEAATADDLVGTDSTFTLPAQELRRIATP